MRGGSWRKKKGGDERLSFSLDFSSSLSRAREVLLLDSLRREGRARGLGECGHRFGGFERRKGEGKKEKETRAIELSGRTEIETCGSCSL
jgi:hypothetical protein